MTDWAKTAMRMVEDYGATSRKGDLLLTVAALCKGHAENMIQAQVPSCYEMGSDFAGEEMTRRVLGLGVLFPDFVTPLVTHDLNSFTIKSVPGLLTAIRLEI